MSAAKTSVNGSVRHGVLVVVVVIVVETATVVVVVAAVAVVDDVIGSSDVVVAGGLDVADVRPGAAFVVVLIGVPVHEAAVRAKAMNQAIPRIRAVCTIARRRERSRGVNRCGYTQDTWKACVGDPQCPPSTKPSARSPDHAANPAE